MSTQARGLGAGLLRDAILRTLQAAELGGIRAILVHAISGDAKRFYERYGFAESPVEQGGDVATGAPTAETIQALEIEADAAFAR